MTDIAKRIKNLSNLDELKDKETALRRLGFRLDWAKRKAKTESDKQRYLSAALNKMIQMKQAWP